MRNDGRSSGDLRPVAITPGFVRTATGSALFAQGGTRVICTASAVEDVDSTTAAGTCSGSEPDPCAETSRGTP